MRSTGRPAPGAAWLLVGVMAGALVAARFETVSACLAGALLGVRAAGARRPSRPWAAAVATGVAIAWALNLFLAPGRAILVLGPLVATREGFARGALYALRLVAAMISVHGLRSAWPGERAADELARLLAPLERLRVPVRELRAMLGLALRFAPLLADEAHRIARLQDLRAGRPPRGLGEWLRRRRAATVPALVRTLERAEQVALALEARHYRLRPVAGRALGLPASGWARVAAGGTLAAASLGWRG